MPRVALEFHFPDPVVGALSSTGAWAAACHFPILRCVQEGPLASAMLARVEALTQKLHEQGLRALVHGIPNAQIAAEIQKLDVDFATSEVLWPGRATPVTRPDETEAMLFESDHEAQIVD